MLECTGRLQKCRLYQMSNDKAYRSTVSYLIVRDLVHEKVFAKALETLGVDWGKSLPVPKFDTSSMPEVKELERKNLHNQMWTFTNKGEISQFDKIFKGESPFDDGGTLEVIEGISTRVRNTGSTRCSTRICVRIRFRVDEINQELQTAASKKV